MKLQLMACEVGLPTALALRDVQENVAAELRRDYPWQAMAVGEARLLLSSRDEDWKVWLSPKAIGLETRLFRGFDEFRRRLLAVMESITPLVQGFSYPRVGLRSVRSLLKGREALCASVPPPVGHVFRCMVQGLIPPVQYSMTETLDPERREVFFLDIDVFVREVAVADLDVCLEDIYRAGQSLAPDVAVPPRPGGKIAAAGQGLFSLRWAPSMPTTIAGYPHLLPPGEVESLAAERADLLRRHYLGGPLSAGDEDRLAAVTARLDKLLPSVTAEDFEEIERVALRAREIGQRTTRRQRELGWVEETEGA